MVVWLLGCVPAPEELPCFMTIFLVDGPVFYAPRLDYELRFFTNRSKNSMLRCIAVLKLLEML